MERTTATLSPIAAPDLTVLTDEQLEARLCRMAGLDEMIGERWYKCDIRVESEMEAKLFRLAQQCRMECWRCNTEQVKRSISQKRLLQKFSLTQGVTDLAA